MTPQRAHAGKFHAGGACADDEDLFRMGRLDLGRELAVGIRELAFLVAFIVADAADGLAGLRGVETQRVAADARTDAVVFPGHGLLHQVRIGQKLTADDRAVEVAALDNFLCQPDVLAHAHDDRGLDLGLDLAAEVVPVAEGYLHRDERHRGIMPAGGD